MSFWEIGRLAVFAAAWVFIFWAIWTIFRAVSVVLSWWLLEKAGRLKEKARELEK